MGDHVTLVSTSTTLNVDFDTYLVDASGGSITLTVPSASADGQHFFINRIDSTDANTLTITSQDTINGASSIMLAAKSDVEIDSFNGVWYLFCSNGFTTHQGPPTMLANANATLTTTQLLTKILVITPTNIRTLTLPTAANAVAGVIGARVSDALNVYIINTGVSSIATVNLSMGTGGTMVGNNTVNNATSGRFKLRFTNVTSGSEAYTVYRLA
jgi:hypothetical protein